MSFSNNEITSFLPLTPYVFQILLALADGEKHGYGVMVDVREKTGGSVRLGTGTLYTAIKRLLGQRIIQKRPAPGDAPAARGDSGKRQYYGLTALGAAVAKAEAERLDAMLEIARERKLLGARRTIGRTAS